LQLILMRWRKVPPSVIVSSMIESTKAGLSLDPNELEAHFEIKYQPQRDEACKDRDRDNSRLIHLELFLD